jgi:hypothetical protein
MIQGFESTINKFRMGLKVNWTSPKAVEFGEKTYESFYDLLTFVVIAYGGLLDAVGNAARIMATANGFSFDLSEYTNAMYRVPGAGTRSFGMTLGPGLYDSYDEQDSEGNVGMNINQVKTLLQDFTTEMTKYKAEVLNYNPDISIFDADGSIRSLYKYQQSNIAENIDTLASSVKKLVEESINTETDMVVKGTAEALAELDLTKAF